jgi:hypothetical protein
LTPARSRHLKVIDATISGQPGVSDELAIASADHEPELADLRYFWGGAYRITWQGRFRATHIMSGEAVKADSAAAMRELLLDRQCRHGRET